MRGIRFSVKGLLVGVAVVALGCVALLNASSLWVTIVYSVTILMLLTALLAFACQSSPRRAFWMGFAIFGSGYLLIAEHPMRDEPWRAPLPTQAALDRLHEAVSHEVTRELRDSEYLDALDRIPPEAVTGSFGHIERDESGAPALISQLSVMLPIKPYFDRIGHCLWAWLLALVGGFLARYFYLAQERKP